MKTPKEIEDLKKSWKKDPIWDIEETEGFEEHYYELKCFRMEENLKNTKRFNHALLDRAKQNNLPSNIQESQERYRDLYFSDLENAARLLEHYFSVAGVEIHSDVSAEIQEIVDRIAEAATNKVLMKLTNIFKLIQQ